MTHYPKEFFMKKGYFGEFGGCFVPELLMPPLLELEEACTDILPGEEFRRELDGLLRGYAGRETPLTLCPTLSRELGFNLYLKREDLLHTGAHKMNNTLGQALLARRMGKSVLAAETGAGQHGVATAAAAARLGLSCVVFMGEEDTRRQAANVMRMRLLGAEVRPVASGTRTLKDAINEALRFWIAEQRTTHYCFGTAAGPHPFPTLVRDLQSVIGEETKAQCRSAFGALPDVVVACVGGGSNAAGMFYPFVADPEAGAVRLAGIEAGGTGEPGCFTSAPLNLGTPGVLHGQYSMLLQDADGQIQPSHSVSAGLDYPGVGPEHAWFHKAGKVEYHVVVDAGALHAFARLCRGEGIIPALESSHALAWVLENAEALPAGGNVVVNLSGRGDKDMDIIREHMPDLCMPAQAADREGGSCPRQ
jgi:tryptophan synthase beta chain